MTFSRMIRTVTAGVLFVSSAGCSKPGSPAPPAPPPAPAPAPPTAAATTTPAPVISPPPCRPAAPLANVYRPSRLKVIDPCKTVSGRVMTLGRDTEGDGDLKFTLKPDPQFEHLVNDVNRREQYGYLVIEIVPADQVGCTPGLPPRPPERNRDFGVCTGANVAMPEPAARVTVTGAYVIDVPHGWAEIRPAWSITPAGP